MLFGEGAAQVAGIASFGDIPLVVIGSGKPNPAFGPQGEAFQQLWIEQNRALARKSAAGAFLLARESGHALYQEAPDLVLGAIRQMVSRAR